MTLLNTVANLGYLVSNIFVTRSIDACTWKTCLPCISSEISAVPADGDGCIDGVQCTIDVDGYFVMLCVCAFVGIVVRDCTLLLFLAATFTLISRVRVDRFFCVSRVWFSMTSIIKVASLFFCCLQWWIYFQPKLLRLQELRVDVRIDSITLTMLVPFLTVQCCVWCLVFLWTSLNVEHLDIYFRLGELYLGRGPWGH